MNPVPHSISYPVRDGNTFTPLVDILPTYTAICTAAEQATHSVWVAISFIDAKWELPGGRGKTLEYLDKLAAKGLDVRVLAWANPEFYSKGYLQPNVFVPYLRDHKSRIKVRWDHSPDERHCHHEKSWLVDGLSLLDPSAEDKCIIFTGGIVIGGPLTGQGHEGTHANRHDIFCSLTGPAATDMVHSFVQRWNGARGPKNAALVCHPDATVANELPFPSRLSAYKLGASRCQVLRTVCPNHYQNKQLAAICGPAALDVSQGEDSIYMAYKMAISSAKRYIYIENQHIAHGPLLDMMHEAMNRGVLVLYVVPGGSGIVHVLRAERDAAEAWQKNRSLPQPWYASLFLETLPRMGNHPNFVLAGVRSEYSGGWIYVHSKLMIVDDEWVTLGSANFVDISFEKDHTEVNIACWDNKVVKSLRHSLVCEHRKQAAFITAEGDGRDAIAAAMQEARSNQMLLARAAIAGRLVGIDPSQYGRDVASAAPGYKVRYPLPGK